jgi:hypothetical protein
MKVMAPTLAPEVSRMAVLMYLMYLTISVVVTVWVARTLSKNGLVFLVDAFQGNRELANSVNHLLVVGFYLINVGFVALALQSDMKPATWRELLEILSWKQGMVLITLGAMHFINVAVFNKMRNRGILRHQPPPVQPRQFITPPPPPPHHPQMPPDPAPAR